MSDRSGNAGSRAGTASRNGRGKDRSGRGPNGADRRRKTPTSPDDGDDLRGYAGEGGSDSPTRPAPAPGTGKGPGRLDYISLSLLFVGLMALLWAIAPPGETEVAFKTEMRWLMLALAAISLGGFAYYFRRGDVRVTEVDDPTRVSTEFMTDEELEAVRKDWTIAERLIDMFTFSGTLKPYIPYAGIGVIIADIAYNLYTGDTSFRTFDTIVIIMGATLIAYNWIPHRFSRERDFAVLFFFFMCIFLVYFMKLIVDPLGESTRGGAEGVQSDPNLFIKYLLTDPVAAFLRLLGVDVTANGEMLTFENRFDDTGPGSVWVGDACTGIYSTSIFLSMYLAFLMSEFKKFTRRMGGLLLLGVGMAYFANILRMCIIIMAGVYYGPDVLYWTHKEVGWMIFMAWVFVFWWGSNRMLERRDG